MSQPRHSPSSFAPLRRPLHLNPEDAQVWFNLGCCYTACGDPKAALAVYEEGLKGDLDHIGCWMNKGSLLPKAPESLAIYAHILQILANKLGSSP
ncbi:MAG: tetratricopeptide repeat protein [Cyanobacteriota bacterium]